MLDGFVTDDQRYSQFVSSEGYDFLATVGQGGKGRVFKVRNRDLGRIEAFKLLKFTDNSIDIQRFNREAKTLARLKNDYETLSIPEIYRYSQQDDFFYYTMRYISGKTLKKRIVERTLSLGESVEIAKELSSILEILHKNKVIHRDIKPANVIIDAMDRTWLVDFGIVKKMEDSLAGSSSSFATGSEMILGTPLYMSPEQIQGEEVDITSDIFSLGTVLYQMITHKIPVAGNSLEELLENILYTPAKAPSMVAENEALMPLDSICLKALEKEKQNRYQNISDFCKDLESAI